MTEKKKQPKRSYQKKTLWRNVTSSIEENESLTEDMTVKDYLAELALLVLQGDK